MQKAMISGGFSIVGFCVVIFSPLVIVAHMFFLADVDNPAKYLLHSRCLRSGRSECCTARRSFNIGRARILRMPRHRPVIRFYEELSYCLSSFERDG